MLVDSHCHLDRLKLNAYANGLPDALTQAREAGVGAFLCVCIDAGNVADVVRIADDWPDVVASVGVHPLDLADTAPDLSFLSQWARHPRVVAVGETGLDYHYASENRQLQMDSFAAHLDFAAQEKLPVIVHTREAVDDTLDLMRAHASRESAGVMHCFTESWDMARQAIDLGFYISFSGIVTFRNAEALREVVKQVPLDRLLIETDSPYLAPIPYRGKPNEPKYLPAVAAEVARLKGVSVEEVIEATGNNFFNLFAKARDRIRAA
ncbi:MAG TPA: TatD family hydrolase [Pseudomonadales bacterium]